MVVSNDRDGPGCNRDRLLCPCKSDELEGLVPIVPEEPPERKPNAPNHIVSLMALTVNAARLVLDFVRFYYA